MSRKQSLNYQRAEVDDEVEDSSSSLLRYSLFGCIAGIVTTSWSLWTLRRLLGERVGSIVQADDITLTMFAASFIGLILVLPAAFASLIAYFQLPRPRRKRDLWFVITALAFTFITIALPRIMFNAIVAARSLQIAPMAS